MRTCADRQRSRWDLPRATSPRRSQTQPPTTSFGIRRRKPTDEAPSEYRPSSWATGCFGETTAWCWSVTTYRRAVIDHAVRPRLRNSLTARVRLWDDDG